MHAFSVALQGGGVAVVVIKPYTHTISWMGYKCYVQVAFKVHELVDKIWLMDEWRCVSPLIWVGFTYRMWQLLYTNKTSFGTITVSTDMILKRQVIKNKWSENLGHAFFHTSHEITLDINLLCPTMLIVSIIGEDLAALSLAASIVL